MDLNQEGMSSRHFKEDQNCECCFGFTLQSVRSVLSALEFTDLKVELNKQRGQKTSFNKFYQSYSISDNENELPRRLINKRQIKRGL